MPVRVLPEFLINQIAAGEVVERPASVVKELVENALDAGADQIVVDVADGGRTLISVIDNGGGMTRDDLQKAITRHATSKLPDDDLLNISFMGFRGEALPSIASVSDMTIDTFNGMDTNGWRIDATTGQVRPSDWDGGTRVRVENLFSKTPARLKFLRGDRAEMVSVLDAVKKLAMARPDVGFTLNNKWRFPKNQDLVERIAAVMGDDVRGRMLDIDVASASTDGLRLYGFVSEPTLRRASSVDQYLFVNGRPVKDKVLVGALRAAYMDVMHAREFPLCALYLTLDPHRVDVNVSPAKTEVHFLEPAHIRAFIIKALRDRLARTLTPAARAHELAATGTVSAPAPADVRKADTFSFPVRPSQTYFSTNEPVRKTPAAPALHVAEGGFEKSFLNAALSTPLSSVRPAAPSVDAPAAPAPREDDMGATENFPLGRFVGQIGNKYIIAVRPDGMVVVDQHAAHERITYEKLRTRNIKTQPLLTPIVVPMRAGDAASVLVVADEMHASGLHLDAFGDDAIAIFEKPADWDMDWAALLRDIADEVRVNGHSSKLNEKLHLKLANYACHHSVRAGQKLSDAQCDALLRQIEQTARGGECNHGRPVYKIIDFSEMDAWFERG